MSYFLQLDGIAGDATDIGHENWFPISGVRWAVVQSSSAHAGGGAGAGKAVLQPVTFTSALSAATPTLFVQCATGRHLARAVLEGVRDGEQRGVAWRWEFDDVTLTSLSLEGTGGDPALAQTFSIDYRRIRLTTFTQSPDGGTGTQVTGGWDLAAGTHL